ncbi:BglG family transcription antiterminator [Alkalicoccobacillus porphyridii]|uniref:BglG family transcription antiterminator n=1 Tax=Alkalicoccobacillus porphyridii TaxID=2597270 RepID=A0A554A480_9BACI|nr:PTS sugar transporter subunit IIA [Alkalicoccobacillus porphyridii]TSB48499.1 BglG family transcription antiterminator [Alkalicoccobacillus porphyridii]
MLSIRQKELLERLMSERDFLSLESIKEVYQLSPRTIRQDLLEIEEWLLEVGAELTLERNRKRGARLVVTSEQEQTVLRALHRNQDFLNANQRWVDMMKRLLLQEVIPLEELEEEYSISHSTMQNDLNRLKEQLADYELMLVRESKRLFLKGNERHKRMLFVDLLRDVIPEQDVFPLFISEDRVILPSDPLLRVSQLWVSDLIHLIHILESHGASEFVDDSKYELFLNGIAQVSRVRRGHLIELTVDDELRIFEQASYGQAREVFARLLHLDENTKPLKKEMSYFAMHILGARRLSQSTQVSFSHEQTARAIVTRFEQENQTRLSRREDVISGLAIHLKSAIYRLKFGTTIENSFYPQLEKEYGLYLDQLASFIKSSPEWRLTDMSKHEIGFLAIHLCAALVHKPQLPVRRVAIVCSSGVGTSMMLEGAIRRLFPQVVIIGQYSVQQAHQLQQDEVDLLITTIPFTTSVHIDWIKVSPLVNMKEQQELEIRLGVKAAQEKTDLEMIDTVQSVFDLVMSHAKPDQPRALYQDLYRFFTGSRKQDQGHVTSFISIDSIHLQVSGKDWRSCIQVLHTCLERNHFVSSGYGEEIIREVESGHHSYIIAPGIAFPHLRSPSVLSCGFAIMTLEEPIRFGHSDDYIWWIILLAPVDQSQHSKVVEMILETIHSEKKLKWLQEESNIENVWDWMRVFEEGDHYA